MASSSGAGQVHRYCQLLPPTHGAGLTAHGPSAGGVEAEGTVLLRSVVGDIQQAVAAKGTAGVYDYTLATRQIKRLVRVGG
jgi:hypothetical protein